LDSKVGEEVSEFRDEEFRGPEIAIARELAEVRAVAAA